MKVSVVICAHTEERWDDLLAAVASVRAQSPPPHEVIVVIDHNPALLRRAETHVAGATVIANDRVRGLGGARNAGLSRATGDVVAFLDDDAVASPQWLRRMAGAYEDPAVLGVGGDIVPHWEAGRPGWYPQEFDWTVGCTYRGMRTDVHEVRNLIGCNMSFRREVFEQAGTFRLGYGCDETEFCIRLSRVRPDGRLLHVPEASVSHRVPPSRGTLKHFVKRSFFEGGSKAVVSRLVGPGAGLESERAYTAKVLPAGVLSGLRDFVGRRDADGLRRAAAIVLGLLATVAGYLAGLARLQSAAERRGWEGDSLLRRGAAGAPAPTTAEHADPAETPARAA